MIVKQILWSCVVVGVIYSLVTDYDRAQKEGWNMTLTRLRPASYDYLIALAQGKESFQENKIQPYENYYQKIVRYYPQMAEAYGMLGFCAYKKGDLRRAVTYYEKAKDRAPFFFWYSFNLGILYSELGQYPLAVQNLLYALKLEPDASLLFIRQSPFIYMPITSSFAPNFGVLHDQLNAAKEDAGEILAYAFHQLDEAVQEKLLAKVPDLRAIKQIKAPKSNIFLGLY